MQGSGLFAWRFQFRQQRQLQAFEFRQVALEPFDFLAEGLQLPLLEEAAVGPRKKA